MTLVSSIWVILGSEWKASERTMEKPYVLYPPPAAPGVRLHRNPSAQNGSRRNWR